METEEQRKRRLDSTWTQNLIRQYEVDHSTWTQNLIWQYEAELARVVKEEMAKVLKRMYNNVPTVSDKIRRLPNK